MHYYQFNIADYRKDTMHLSRLEHGIYRDLIDWYYLDELPIPNETQVVSRRLRLVSQEEAAALQNVLSDFFVRSDDGYRHSRIDAEIANYYATCEKNKENGKKGGRPKASKPLPDKEDNPVGYQSVATGIPNETQINPNQEPITVNQEPVLKPTAQKPRLDLLLSAFEEFWSAYPQRPGASKADTLKAWKARIKESVSASAMMDGAARYKAYCIATGTEPQYIKQPATFIGTGKHYESDWTPPKPSQQITSWQDKKQAADDATAAVLYGTRQERIIEGVTLCE